MRANRVLAIAGIAASLFVGCEINDGATPLEKVTSDPDYRALAAHGAAEGIFKDMTDTDAFAKAKQLGSHASLVAFQETYSDSPLVVEADNELLQFRAFTASKTTFVPSETLTKEWCWGNSGLMSRWNSRMGGMHSNSGARFGDLLFRTDIGIVQMVSGGYRAVEGGIEVTEGTTFIFQAECEQSVE